MYFTAGTTETELKIETSGLYFTVSIDGCSFSGFQKDVHMDMQISGELNGHNINFTYSGLASLLRVDGTVEGTI